MSDSSVPRSGFDKVGGLLYFARMLDKVRRHARGQLRADFQANLGKGADGWCSGFLHVDYAVLRERVLKGGSDEEILAWCAAHWRQLNDVDIMIWNQFIAKLGWNDFAAQRLAEVKRESGLAERDDIQTMMQYFDVDEGRKP